MELTTQARILDYLQKTPSATAEELSRHLGKTGADIRHHLSQMLEQGQVEELDKRKEGKGRPTKVYGASEKVLGNGLVDLLKAALEAWLAAASSEEKETRLKSLADALGGDDSNRILGISQRLGLAVDHLNLLHYRARWEAGAKGPRMILGRCPYAAIVNLHPELCRMDEYLLKARSGMEARLRSKMELTKEGTRRCIFSLE